jgi:hypothetical protein
MPKSVVGTSVGCSWQSIVVLDVAVDVFLDGLDQNVNSVGDLLFWRGMVGVRVGVGDAMRVAERKVRAFISLREDIEMNGIPQ